MHKNTHIWLVVQQGGSRNEAYIVTRDTLQDAQAFRKICTTAGYRSSPPLKIPRELEKHLEILEVIVQDAVALR